MYENVGMLHSCVEKWIGECVITHLLLSNLSTCAIRQQKRMRCRRTRWRQKCRKLGADESKSGKKQKQMKAKMPKMRQRWKLKWQESRKWGRGLMLTGCPPHLRPAASGLISSLGLMQFLFSGLTGDTLSRYMQIWILIQVQLNTNIKQLKLKIKQQ